MHNIHWRKISAAFVLCTCFCFSVKAQEHLPNYDNEQRFRFGISIVPSVAKFKLVPSADFYQRDSVRSMRVQSFPGFGFGGIADMRIGRFWNLRALPQLHFMQRNVDFTFQNGLNQVIKVESVTGDLPILLKYRSIRHRNQRFYVIGGFRFSHDFASNEDAERGPLKPLIATKKNAIYYEFGIGMDYFLTFSPISVELKMSNSITNMLSTDPYIYSSSISRIQARVFQISFHLQ